VSEGFGISARLCETRTNHDNSPEKYAEAHFRLFRTPDGYRLWKFIVHFNPNGTRALITAVKFAGGHALRSHSFG
jgi:hypothetical protein